MRLLIAFLLPMTAQAALSALDVKEVSDGAMSFCATKLTGDSVRNKFHSSSSFPDDWYNVPNTSTDTTVCMAVSGGFAPGSTIYVQPQYNSGVWTDYDCDADGSKDLSVDLGGTGSVVCNASGYLEVTLEAAGSMTPNPPTGLPTVALPTLDAGRVVTASDCDDIGTLYTDLGDDAPDGNADQIELAPGDWECADQLVLSGKTNTDDIVITSTRWNTTWCPPAGVIAGPEDIDGCMPRLWYDSVDTFIVATDPGTYFNRIVISTPPAGHAAYGETGTISSDADSGADLDLTVTAHGMSDPGSPDCVTVALCTEAVADSAVGTYCGAEFSLPDVNTVRLVGQAGLACTGGFAYQNPTGAASSSNALIDLGDGFTGGLDQVVFEQRWPYRTTYSIFGDHNAVGSTDWYIANYTVVGWGNWFPINGPVVSIPSPFTSDSATAVFVRMERTSRFVARNGRIEGTGLGVFMADTFTERGTDLLFEKHLMTLADERRDSSSSSGDDGIDGVQVAGRGYFAEFKNGARGEIDGLLFSRIPNSTPGNSRPAPVYLRNGISSGSTDGSRGTFDWSLRNITVNESWGGPALEGQRWDQGGSLGRMAGGFEVFNLLINDAQKMDETVSDVMSRFDGVGVELIGHLNRVFIDNVTNYKPQGQGAPFRFNRMFASRLQMEDQVLAATPRALNSPVFVRVEDGGNMSPSSAPGTTEGAQAFYHGACLTEGACTNSYLRDLKIVGGLEVPGTDFGLTSDGDRLIDSETLTQYTSTDYTFPDVTDHTSAAGTSIQSDIDDMGLTANLEAATGEGYDYDLMREGIGLLGVNSTKLYVGELERSGDNGITIYFRAPTSTDTCYVDHWRFGTLITPTRVTVAVGAKDRSATITGVAGHRERFKLYCQDSPHKLWGAPIPGKA